MFLCRADGDFRHIDATAFAACRRESIDYALLEHAAKTPGAVAVVLFTGAWSDVGSWTAVADLRPADALLAATSN